MTDKQAKEIIVTLVSQSHFFKGFLCGRDAWGIHGFPTEDLEINNLKDFLRQLAEAIQTKITIETKN